MVIDPSVREWIARIRERVVDLDVLDLEVGDRVRQSLHQLTIRLSR
jgi:hypothetical protein